MNADTTVLTIKQLVAAHLLARAHGHLWAVVLEAADLPSTPEEIRFAVGAKHGDDIGIFYPEVNAYKYEGEPEIVFIIHQTGSGRLSWTVNSDGDTEVTVSRPAGQLFSFRIEFGAIAPVDIFVNDLADEVGIGQRHVDAAAKAICALTGRTKEQALNSLRAEGIEPCGPAHMAEKVTAACWELAHHYLERPAEMEHHFTWHSNPAELAAIVSLTVARNHVKTDPTRPWVRAAQNKADMAEYWEALEEDLQASE